MSKPDLASVHVRASVWPRCDLACSYCPVEEGMENRSGLLAVTWLLVLLPIGAALQIVGLCREGRLPRRQAALTILGLLLLLNPDIEIISAAGALLMASGYLSSACANSSPPRSHPPSPPPPVPATH
jgi:hypothetical protein